MVNNWTEYKIGSIDSSNDTYADIVHLTQAQYDALENPDPDTLYSTPDSDDASSYYSVITVTLASDWWTDDSQTVWALWVTDSNTVIVSPIPTDMQAYWDAQIYCSAQWVNELTFSCGSTPEDDITVTIMIFK